MTTQHTVTVTVAEWYAVKSSFASEIQTGDIWTIQRTKRSSEITIVCADRSTQARVWRACDARH